MKLNVFNYKRQYCAGSPHLLSICISVCLAGHANDHLVSTLVRPVTLMQGLSDITICEGDIAQLEVRFSQENVEGTWMKSDQAITATDRIHIVIDKLTHKLLIEDANKNDTGAYSFIVPSQDISTSGKLFVQSKKPHYRPHA